MSRLPFVLLLFSGMSIHPIASAQADECKLTVTKELVISGPSALQKWEAADGTAFEQAFLHSVPGSQGMHEETKLRVPANAIRFVVHSGWLTQGDGCAKNRDRVLHGIRFKLIHAAKEAQLEPQKYGDTSQSLVAEFPARNIPREISLRAINENGGWCGAVLWGDPVFIVKKTRSGKCT